MTTNDTKTIHNEQEPTMKEHAMTDNMSNLHTLAVAALIALGTLGSYAGPAGQAGKVAAKAATKAVVGETIQASAEKAAREAAEKVAREAAERVARETAERATREAAEHATREAAERATREAAERATREAAERATREAAERATREAAERATREVAERGVRKVAAEAATTAVSESTAKLVVKQVTRPKTVLAIGAGTAAVVGSHNVTKGVRNTAEAVGTGIKEGIETVADKNPELLPRVIKEGTRPVTSITSAITSLVALAILGFAIWLGLPYLVSVRKRIARNVSRAERENPPSRSSDREDGEIVDAEYEMRG